MSRLHSLYRSLLPPFGIAALSFLPACASTAQMPNDVAISRLAVAFASDRPGLNSEKRSLGAPASTDMVFVKAEVANPFKVERHATFLCADDQAPNSPRIKRDLTLPPRTTRHLTEPGFMAAVVDVPIRCRLTFPKHPPTAWVRVVIPMNDGQLDLPR